MARRLRVAYEGAVYHITARGNERQKIFIAKTDYERFLHHPAEAKKKQNIALKLRKSRAYPFSSHPDAASCACQSLLEV